jgi:hypothetical protein
MPRGTKVDRCYQKVKASGASKGKAARICQVSTGLSLATGKPPKGKKRKPA